MKKSLKSLISASIFLAMTGPAAAVNIGGIDLPSGPFLATGEVFTNAPAPGGTLRGYGRINTINSQFVADLCSGCEMTFVFDSYNFAAAVPPTSTFTGGRVQVFLGFGADRDFSTINAGGSAGDVAEASNGTPFLTLKGHALDASGTTFVSTGTPPNVSGNGLLDVDVGQPGIANSYFNGNGFPAFGGNADMNIGSIFSGFSSAYPGDCATDGAGCLHGALFLEIRPVPEPGVYALMVAGLGLVAFAARRRRV